MIIRVVDVETCGLEAPDLQIVEVATLDLVSDEAGTSWLRGRQWSSLVNPGRPIPAIAMAVHHITDEMVKDAPTFSQLPSFLSLEDVAGYKPDALCAHRARFDVAALAAHGVQGLADRPWLCSYKAAVTLWPDAPSFKNQVLRYWLGLKLDDPSLATPHRAAGDAYVTGALARRVLRQLTLSHWIEVSAGPIVLPHFHFGEHAGKPIADVPTSYFDWIVNKAKGPWDEDVMHTAKRQLAKRAAAGRSRSPV